MTDPAATVDERELIERLERDLERWWSEQLTSPELVVRLRRAADDLDLLG